MTARTVKEWIGKTPDTAVPPRVRDRVLTKFSERCAKCTRPIRSGDGWTCDHIKALINGGENRERNLQPLCDWCNPDKNRADVAEKSSVYAKRSKHRGIKRRTGPPMMGTRASGWKKKIDGTVVRRETRRRG